MTEKEKAQLIKWGEKFDTMGIIWEDMSGQYIKVTSDEFDNSYFYAWKVREIEPESLYTNSLKEALEFILGEPFSFEKNYGE